MNHRLETHVVQHFNKPGDGWLSESFTLPSEETFQEAQFQLLFEGKELGHYLYYSETDDDSFFPFEVYDGQTLIALGYMIEDQQHLLYLKYNNEVLVEEL